VCLIKNAFALKIPTLVFGWIIQTLQYYASVDCSHCLGARNCKP